MLINFNYVSQPQISLLSARPSALLPLGIFAWLSHEHHVFGLQITKPIISHGPPCHGHYQGEAH